MAIWGGIILRTILYSALICAASVSANAQSDSDGLLDALRDLEQRIGELEARAPIAIPRNVVLAFDQAECPEGWERYNEADGRFILGVREGMPLRATGGSEAHRLTIEEMPTHDHGAVFGGDGRKAGMLNEWPYHASGYERMRPTGGGRPHNNMPPYIALIYCKKL